MYDYSKKTKKEIRRLAGLAHERELEKALVDFNFKFKQWEKKDLDSFELEEYKWLHLKENDTIKNRDLLLQKNGFPNMMGKI